MANRILTCLDVETIPERGLLPADTDFTKFQPLPFHRIVAISLLNAEIKKSSTNRTEWLEVTAIGSRGRDYCDEEWMVREFWSFFNANKPRLVTWNGRSFDCTLLSLKAMVYGIQTPAWVEERDRSKGYSHRYGSEHVDLMDTVSNYGAAKNMKMDDVCKVMGLPGKFGGHGTEVEAMYREGRLDDVANYCEGDVMNLFGLYVRHAFQSCKMDEEGQNRSMQSLFDFCQDNRAARPHLGEFADLWSTSDRPAPHMLREFSNGPLENSEREYDDAVRAAQDAKGPGF